MRPTIAMLFAVGAACSKKDPGPPAATGSAHPTLVAATADAARPVVPPPDAALPDASPPDALPDASPPDALPKLDVDKLLDLETIGPLKLGMTDTALVAMLGTPSARTKPVVEGATGSTVSDWSWPGVTVGMAADRASGPFAIRSIQIAAPSSFATSRGIKIGSTLAELKRAYPRSPEPTNDPSDYLVGSVYGGELFGTKAGHVTSVFLGAMAF